MTAFKVANLYNLEIPVLASNLVLILILAISHWLYGPKVMVMGIVVLFTNEVKL